MPIDNCFKPFASASARSFAKYGRDGSASSDQGGMVIRPSSRKCGHPRITSTSAGTSPGAAPALASSADSFTSIITSSGFCSASNRRASFCVSTVWNTSKISAAIFDLFDCRCPIR